VDAIEGENSALIDLVNQQEHGGDGLFEAVKALVKGRNGAADLERVAEALQRVDVNAVAEVVVKGLERRAKGQGRFWSEKQAVVQMQNSNINGTEEFVPENEVERYQFYLTCLKSVIDHEK
jgi:hypothetical protein